MEPIVIEHLSKKYGQFVAVDDLSLTVERGVCVGYLGPNGAGKTTTIKVLTNLLRASSGRAFLNGIDVIRHPKAALDGVGAVVETPEFYSQLTPYECLSYVGTIRGMSGEAIAERSRVVLEQVKLLDVADKRTGQFSKGMKQRLAIAQALLHEPSILILDEPTAGLDPRGMVEVRDIIKGLIQTDITILMSSHLLYEVQEVCDKVAIIDRGKLLTYDSVASLSAGHDVTVTINTLEPITPPEFRAIRALRGVKSLKRTNTLTLNVSFSGGPDAQFRVLRGILNSGVKVVSYMPQRAVIEDLYLQLVPEGEA
ncbi:MAG TPA: ABC transporter ATP-binding protein [Candidatus Bathyarchaeia archaeon]|nr:ABC transporter ATP-binding protein [Candidatus Bathyarchaeia archaeon]